MLIVVGKRMRLGLEGRRVPQAFNQAKVDRQVDLRKVDRAVPSSQTVVRQADLAEQDAIAEAIGQSAKLGRDSMRLRLIG